MNKLRSLPKKPLNNNNDQFINKLGARLFLVLIFLAAVGEKILTIYNSSEDNENSPTLYLLTIFDILILVILIFVEYFMHRKLGPKALKYTCVVDILLFIFFSLDWIVSIEYIFNQSGKADLGVLPIVSMLEFTSFGWKVLVQVFIFRQWFLRILSPILACIVVICFGAIYVPDDLVNIIVRGIAQMLYVVCLFYFEQKLNFKLVSTSRKQEKWMKINEFILSNIPENIAIMDSQGSISYISQYFKEFIRGFNNNMTMENLFKSIKNLQPVEQEFMSSADNLLLLDKSSSSRSPDPSFIQSQRNLIFTERVDSFHDLLRNFRSMIQTRQIKEKSFLIFNGKLHTADLIEKSIEVKISFIRQNLKDYIIIILRDTTQRDLLVSLEDHNKYKDHLLASVSHELRAPLNGNINLIEASIRSPDVPPHIIESLLTPALRSGKLLLHLINDILDMSQIKAQKLRLVFQFADIRETLVNTIQLLEIQAEKKEINLQVNIDHRLPVKFCTDHVRLSQIVLNLMNNAIKFTQLGVVKLTAELTEDTRNIKITIEDSGIGMKPDDLKKLFNKYTRLESNQSARHKKMNPTGVGLGLNIAHNLADLLGPRANTAITATSQVGKGSKFSFVIENKETGLQLQTSKKASNIEESYLIPDEIDLENHSTLDLKMNARFSSRSFKKLSQIGTPLGKPKCKCSKVLVIDDDHFNVMAMESILNSLNAAGDYVYDGKSAIEKILNKIRYSLCLNDCAPYYAIFIDQEMPGFSGAETVQELRSLQRQKVIPEMTLIGCTGHTGKSEVENFVKSGLDQCIQKPVSIDIIKNILIRARAPPAVDSFKASASRL